jgi:hypothetical protein
MNPDIGFAVTARRDREVTANGNINYHLKETTEKGVEVA